MKFLHVADLHLDSAPKGLERYDGAPVDYGHVPTRRALENVVQLALQEEVEFVVIAGDLYDSDWKDYNTGLFFTAEMAKLRAAGIEVFLISGNHDAANVLTKSLRLPENVVHFPHRQAQTELREKWGVAIHGQSFANRKVTEDLSAYYPKALSGLLNIGVLHTSANGRPGHETYAPCTVSGLVAKGYDYWALGHVHTREELHCEPWIVFPGNTQGRHARETGAKGCTLVTFENGRILSVEHRDTDVMRWEVCAVDAAGACDGDAVLAAVERELRTLVASTSGLPLAVRVRLLGACEAHPELCGRPEHWAAQIRALANDAGEVWVEKVVLETSHQRDLGELLRRDDPLARLIRSIHELEQAPGLLDEFLGELDDLKQKLPPELKENDQLLALSTAEQRQRCLEDVRQILLPRLLALADPR